MQLISPLPQRARHSACVKCGSSSSKRQFFDLGVFIEFEGALFLCTVCVIEMGHEIGFITEDQHKNVKDNNQKLLASNAELRVRIEEQNGVIDVLSTERATREREHQTAIEHARNQAIQETEARYSK